MPARIVGDLARSGAVLPLSEQEPLPPEDRVIRPRYRLEDLYRSHAPRLLRYFSRRTGQQDAGDLVQESFLRLADSEVCRAQSLDRPEAYLNRIATNLLRDRARAAAHRSLANHIPVHDALLVANDQITAFEARDGLARLQAALLGLKPKTREIFLAHRLDGLSYKQIAERSGLGIKGVEWHMTKALAQLDRALRR